MTSNPKGGANFRTNGGVADGQANLSQLAARGNYRAATTQDMGNVYSRNSAQRQIPASKFAQKNPNGYKDAESVTNDLPGFSEIGQGGGTSINTEVLGEKPIDWELSCLGKREQLDVLKKDRKMLRGACVENVAQGGQNGNGLIVSQEPIAPYGKPRGEMRFS